MNDTTVQASPSWGTFRRWYLWVAALLALLLGLLWLSGYGPGGAACKLPMSVAAASVVPAVPALAPVAPVPPVEAPAPVAAAAPAVTPATMPAAVPPPEPVVAKSVPVPPAARVLFGLSRTALPADVDSALSEVVSFLKRYPDSKVALAGFHDPSGNQAANEELALNRARAVRTRLDQLGIAVERVVMQKPAETTGSGPAAEARRVEVTVQMP